MRAGTPAVWTVTRLARARGCTRPPRVRQILPLLYDLPILPTCGGLSRALRGPGDSRATAGIDRNRRTDVPNLFLQLGEVLLGHGPDLVQIEAEVFMHQDVAQAIRVAPHSSPW